MLTSAKIGIRGWDAIYKHDRVSQLIYMLLNKIPSQWYDFHTASKVLCWEFVICKIANTTSFKKKF